MYLKKSMKDNASDHLPKLFILLITLFLTDLFALTFVCFLFCFGRFRPVSYPHPVF